MERLAHDPAQQGRRTLRQLFVGDGGGRVRGSGVGGSGVHGAGGRRFRGRRRGRERRGGAVRHHDVRGRVAQDAAQEPQAVLGGEGFPAPVPSHRPQRDRVHGHPAVGPQWPAHRAGPAGPLADVDERLAVVGEGVQEGVGRRVVRLTRVAEHARHRGEGDEEVEREAARRGVEVKDPVDLRRQHRPQVGGVLGEDVRVAEDARRVDDAVDGSVGLGDGADRPVHVGARDHVHGDVVSVDSRVPQLPQGRLARGSVLRPSAQDHGDAGVPAEVAGDVPADPAEAARDPVDPALLQRRDLGPVAQVQFPGP